MLRYGIFSALMLGAAGWAQAQSADLLVSQTYAPNPMPAGGTATYTITVTNAGPGSASGVTLTGALPAGSTFVSVTPPAGGSCTPSGAPVTAFSCTLGNLAFPGSTSVDLKVILPEKGVWKNHATVTSSTPDPNQQNNQNDVFVTVVGNADLKLDASSDKGTDPLGVLVETGEPYNYTLVVTNTGPDDLPAGNAPTVAFEVPGGAMITSPPTGPGWTCTAVPANPYPLISQPLVSQQVQCTRGDALPVGASYPPITVPAVANEAQNGNITANFSVASDFPDGNVSNNLPVVTVYVGPEASADMSIVKIGPIGTIAVGSDVIYVLTPRLNGGVPPTNVTVTDDIPPSLTYSGYDAPAPWHCTYVDHTLTCVYPGTWTGGYTDMPAITIHTTLTDVGHTINTGRVDADQNDPVPGNNASSTGVTGSNDAQLVITKTPSLSPVMVGEPYMYSVVVRNTGPVSIRAGQVVTFTENIPAGMRVTAAITGAGWVCDSNIMPFVPIDGPALITCTYTAAADIGAGITLPYLGIFVVNTAPGNLTNYACVNLADGAATAPPDIPTSVQACTTASVPGTAAPNGADLEIVKTVTGGADIHVGQDLTYVLTVTNHGPGSATGVHVRDPLTNLLSSASPPYVAGFAGATATQGTCTPAGPANGSVTLDCDIGTLAVGQTATVTVVIRPNNTTAGELTRTNTATVDSTDVGDPNRGNNSATATSRVQPRVDVEVIKSVSPHGQAHVGEPLVYVVTARNNGPSTATNVTIADQIPANTAFVDVMSVTGPGVTCAWPAAGATSASANHTMTCTWPSITPGSQYTATYRLRPLQAAQGTDVHNTVHISTDSIELDNAPNNNQDDSVVSVIEPKLDVLVTKTASADPVLLGDDLTYTLVIKNIGMSFGTNLVLTDTFPAPGSGARFSYEGNLSAPGATCTEPPIGALAGTLTCTFPVIAPGDANAITVTYKMHARGIVIPGAWSGTHVNHATVSVNEQEDTLANNQADANTTARLQSVGTDLGIVKTIDKKNVRTGEQAIYTFVVTNHGPLDVEEINGAVVTDTLPAGVHFVSSPDGCFLVDAASNVVMCLVGHLAAGDDKTFHITVSITSTKAGALDNLATVHVEGDTDPNNNTSTVTTLVSADGIAIPSLNLYGLLILLAAIAGMAGIHRKKYRR